MPKPIKKRVQRKEITEKNVVSLYEVIKNYYEDNLRFIHIILAIFIILALLFISGFYYNRHISNKAAIFEYEGYKLSHNLYKNDLKKEEDAIREALEKFQNAYRTKKSPVRLLYIANTQHRLGQYEESLNTLREFIKIYSDNKDLLPIAYYEIAVIHQKMNKGEDALKTLDIIYNLSTTSFLKDLAIFESAKILERLGNGEKAAQKYELLIKDYPNSLYTKDVLSRIKKDEIEGKTAETEDDERGEKRKTEDIKEKKQK